VGAVKFDPRVDELGDKFYVDIDPESCVKHGLRMDVSTVMWWLKQTEEARNAVTDHERLDLPAALEGFADWFGSTSLPTWGNGATFDNVIVRNAYTLCDIACPWEYYDDRCFRTLKSLSDVRPPRAGLRHHALDDAIYQAQTMQMIVRNLGLNL
jgi:exodeoxyribonuclease VIII